MIASFRCKETEKIADGQFSRKLPTDIQRVAARKLKMIRDAVELNDLRVAPANRLESLRVDRRGTVQHPNQRSLANMFQVDPRSRGRGRDRRLPLKVEAWLNVIFLRLLPARFWKKSS